MYTPPRRTHPRITELERSQSSPALPLPSKETAQEQGSGASPDSPREGKDSSNTRNIPSYMTGVVLVMEFLVEALGFL